MSELSRDLAAARDVLASVLLSLAARYGAVHRLVHRGHQAVRALDRWHDEVAAHDELERSGAS